MQKYRTFLTKKGREKIVAAEAAGTHLALRHVAVGDALDPPTEDLTALRNEVWRGEVNRIQVDAKDAHVLNVEAVIPAQDGGFMVRELGLFDTEGDLIAVGRAPDSYKPLVEDGAAKSLSIVFKIVIDNTAVVALSVDDSVVLVTREYLAQQLSLHTTNKDNPHWVTKAQVGLNNVQNYAVATEAEAKEGTSNTKYMTPLRTNQLVGQIAGETAG
ncbi:MAG TPA: phage tail protein, partial [Metalysinibacillus sp.]